MMMEQIRYTPRICDDREKVDRFLREKRVGTLAMYDQNGKPYAVPVNYVYWNGKIYFHGMGSGKKNTILAVRPEVCFTVFEEYGTVMAKMPCKCDTAYFSIVIFGKTRLVLELEEKTQALTQIMEKFTPGLFKTPLSQKLIAKYRSAIDNNAVAVYCITPDELTAKENPVVPAQMFREPQP
jgi:nitroimidazol reductase NimA-like FMN-containing flavoprotein (pyridoxamine 5'-phosphate oxidase superfamily)